MNLLIEDLLTFWYELRGAAAERADERRERRSRKRVDARKRIA